MCTAIADLFNEHSFLISWFPLDGNGNMPHCHKNIHFSPYVYYPYQLYYVHDKGDSYKVHSLKQLGDILYIKSIPPYAFLNR